MTSLTRDQINAVKQKSNKISFKIRNNSYSPKAIRISERGERAFTFKIININKESK